MVKLFSWQRGHIPRSATFTLTELGKQKAENFTGDERTRLLMALDQNGASNTAEISRIARIRKGKVEDAIPGLIRAGYISPVRGGMDE